MELNNRYPGSVVLEHNEDAVEALMQGKGRQRRGFAMLGD